jgi:1-acyl-sn-glycerol-3-phosphate acyltransferase/nucleoside-diphosphate-sugar epimerase
MIMIDRAISRILVVEPRDALSALVVDRLNRLPRVKAMEPGSPEGSMVAAIELGTIDTLVFSPLSRRSRDFTPDLEEANEVLGACSGAGVRHVVLISSAVAYGADYHNPGLIREGRPAQVRRPNQIAAAWRSVESLAERWYPANLEKRLTILRPSLTLVEGSNDWANRLFRRRWALTVTGYNPSIQLLDSADLAEAIARAVEFDASGVFNVAPEGVIPLHQALKAAGVRRISLPYTLQRLARALVRRIGRCSSGDQQDFLRYSWSVSNERSKRDLCVCYRASSLDAPRGVKAPAVDGEPVAEEIPITEAGRYDPFGMNEHFIRVRSRRTFGFLDRCYWRIEISGLENIPREGRAVLSGVHRGFMPFDGVMMVHVLEKHLGRIPRFLMHPALVKYPVLAPFLTNMGGIIACQENADHVLERDEVLGIFPEGIRGAFRLYRQAHTIDRFGRSDFVKMALRNQAPIIPFVILGTAEMFPILAKFEWSWWKRHTEWPFFPITPTFPFLPPVPLPAKWHIRVLPPINLHEIYPAEAAGDARVVCQIGEGIRDLMQQTLDAMREKRRSIFVGSVFDDLNKPVDPGIHPSLTGPLGRPVRPVENSLS